MMKDKKAKDFLDGYNKKSDTKHIDRIKDEKPEKKSKWL
jgi:hypothetical protein